MFRLMRLKPPHGWNAVIWELAIVTLGVLIALGAQQTVEGWSWKRKVAAAEHTMNQEIKNSLLAVAELDRLEHCSTVLFDSLQEAIVREDDPNARRILESGIIFGFTRLWADNAFEATLAAQVSDHLGAEKLKRYSQVYQMIRNARRTQELAEEPPPELAVLYLDLRLNIPPERRYAQVRDVASVRLQRESMRSLGRSIARYAKQDLGLAVTQDEYLAAPGRTEIIKICEGTASGKKVVNAGSF